MLATSESREEITINVIDGYKNGQEQLKQMRSEMQPSQFVTYVHVQYPTEDGQGAYKRGIFNGTDGDDEDGEDEVEND